MIRRLRHRFRRRHTGVAAIAATLPPASQNASIPRSRARSIVLLALLAALVLLTVTVGWRSIRAHLQAVAVLKTLSGEPLSAVLRAAATQPISETDTVLQTTQGTVRARLYTPTLHPNSPAMVVFHGVHHLGIDEPRLVSFSRALAGCGIRVLTPELPDIKDYRVSESSINVIGASTVWYAQQVGKPVGVLGLSFSGGLALVAATNDTYRPSMKFVFAVGSQGSMSRVAAYYRTNEDPRPNGSLELLPAHEYGPLVMEYEHLEQFVPQQDLAALREVLRTHLYEDHNAETAAMEKLTPSQKVEVLQLMNATSDTTRALLKSTEEKYADEMNGLSPEQHLKSLTVPVFLLHGEADNIIPSAETLWMASQLRATTLQAALISPVLSHLDMASTPGAWEEWKLIHFMAKVLEAAKTN